MREHIGRKGIVFGIMILFLASSIVPIAGSIATTSKSTQPIQLHIDVPPVTYGMTKTSNGVFATLEMNDEGQTTTVGEAQLPTITKFVEIPQGAVPELVIKSASWDTTSLDALGLPAYILPVQAPIPKIQGAEESTVFFMNSQYYTQDKFTPSDIATIRDIGELRGHRFAVVEISPIQYKPLTGGLKILTSCDIQLSLPGWDITQTSATIERYFTPTFEDLARETFVNYGTYENGITNFEKTQQGYLVIVYDSFYNAIQPLASWKQNQGYSVTVTKTSQIPGGPTSANIKTYIANAYNQWPIPPSFVLLVGDTPQIPTWTGTQTGSATDLYYVTITVGDYFPDIHIGRFSAATEAQVITMVDKSLSYEQAIYADPNYLHKAVFMASEDNYQISEGTHNYVIATYLQPHGYICDKLYCHTYHATTQQVRDALNNGRHLAIYSGHGGTDSWADGPVFTQSDINGLTNYHMYPFVCSHACLTGDFGSSECFGETWLRAPNKGGFAFWGASTLSYWDEDDILERSMFSAWWNEDIKAIGGMTDRAKILLYQHYGGGGSSLYYFEEYNLLGDPSVNIKPPFLFQHNVGVQSIDVASHVTPGQQVNVATTVVNNGLHDEHNVQVVFRIDGVQQGSTVIPFFQNQTFQQINFQWTPPVIGIYTLTVNVSILGVQEDVYYDNEMSTQVIAGPDVAVTSITAPDYAAVGRPTTVSGNVANIGTVNEFVTVSFLVNGVVNQTQQVYLASGGNQDMVFNWIPSVAGTYPVSIVTSISDQEPYLGNNQMSKNVSVFVANGIVLLVIDDAGGGYQSFFENALMADGYLYQEWNHASQGTPPVSTMQSYDTVIWYTGLDYSETLNTQDQTNLQTYLAAGGRLFITGQDIGYGIGSTAFYHNYMHATYQVDDAGPRVVVGTVGDPIGNGLTLAISGGDGANDQSWPDGIQAISPGWAAFTYQSSSYKAAILSDTGGYRAVYFAFGFEAISTQADRNEVMRRVLVWLNPPRLTLEGDCFYQNQNPVAGLSVDILDLTTKKTWQATINNNHYSILLTPGRDVNATETLRITARDGTDCVNITDHVVTAGEVTAGTIQIDLTLNIHYRDLKKFPFYTATMDTGAAIAQMMLNYLWWNSTTDPSGPPMHYANQQTLFTAFNTQGGLYLNGDEMCVGLNQYKPLPIETYGYFFNPSASTNANDVLKDICVWLDFTYGVPYYPGLPDNWPAPGHPANVPIAVPLDGNYNHWVAIRGIHTDREAWQDYPEFPSINVYGFWVNDPKNGGLGGNTYVTASQFLTTYFKPISVVGDTYKNKYLALTDPPEGIHVDTSRTTVTLATTPNGLTVSESKIVQAGIKATGSMRDLAYSLLVTAAQHAVQNVLKYDRTDLLNIFQGSQVQGKPIFNGDTCIITFSNQKVTFQVQLFTKTGTLKQFSINGL